MSNTTRQSGYYRVKPLDGEWVIANWYAETERWFVMGDIVPYPDWFWTEINESPINPNPNE